jgi:hypothetical protein
MKLAVLATRRTVDGNGPGVPPRAVLASGPYLSRSAKKKAAPPAGVALPFWFAGVVVGHACRSIPTSERQVDIPNTQTHVQGVRLNHPIFAWEASPLW